MFIYVLYLFPGLCPWVSEKRLQIKCIIIILWHNLWKSWVHSVIEMSHLIMSPFINLLLMKLPLISSLCFILRKIWDYDSCKGLHSVFNLHFTQFLTFSLLGLYMVFATKCIKTKKKKKENLPSTISKNAFMFFSAFFSCREFYCNKLTFWTLSSRTPVFHRCGTSKISKNRNENL